MHMIRNGFRILIVASLFHNLFNDDFLNYTGYTMN